MRMLTVCINLLIGIAFFSIRLRNRIFMFLTARGIPRILFII